MREEEILMYKNLINVLSNDGNSSGTGTEDDKTFRKNTTEQISSRDAKYTELLSHFVDITRARNNLKELFKWTFYLTVIGSIIVLTNIVYRLFNQYIAVADIEGLVEAMPLLITSMVGFVSTIITIPVTITKYLFSTEEDKNITEIILHTQKHDTSGRKWAMDFKKIVDEFDIKGENSIKKQEKSS